jgi:5-methyltetrahydrofolate--homocysteine methyltransferase
MNTLVEIANGVIAGDDELVGKLTQQLIDEKAAPASILDDGLIAGMNVVGERFKNHEIEGVPSMGKVVIGSVRGDLHDIGKNLVGIMLQGAGFDVIDLGRDVAPEQMIEAVQQHDAAVIGMSALLTTTMPVMGEVVERVHKEGLTDTVKTIVGGAPLNAEFATDIGADAYGYDAANAVDRVKQLMGKP